MKKKVEFLVKPCDGFTPIDWFEKYKHLPKSNYSLDEVKIQDLYDDMEVYEKKFSSSFVSPPIPKSYMIKNEVSGMEPQNHWKANDINFEFDLETDFDKMTIEHQGYFLAIQSSLLAIENIPEPEILINLKRKYYENKEVNK